MYDLDAKIDAAAATIREIWQTRVALAHKEGYAQGFACAHKLETERRSRESAPATVIGSRYTTTGRFDDEPRENEVEYDSHLYATPKEVWEKEWLRTWMEMNESVGTLITQDEYFRVGYMIAEMARKNAVGRVKFTYGRGIYVYETLEVELSMRVIS